MARIGSTPSPSPVCPDFDFLLFRNCRTELLSATRVVSTKTKRADLDNFRLLPTETLELWSKDGRKYVTLRCRIVRGHHETLDRLNGITTYLKALYRGV